jgi:hypothetical protein
MEAAGEETEPRPPQLLAAHLFLEEVVALPVRSRRRPL